MKLLSEFLLVTVWKCSFLFILRSFRILFFYHFLCPSQNTSANSSILLCEADKPLSERLKISPGEQVDYIPAQLLRKVKNLYTSYILNHILYIHCTCTNKLVFNLFETAFSIELHVEWNFYLFYESFQVKVQSFIVNFIYIHTCTCMQHVHNLQITCMFDLFECNFKI